MTPKQGFFLTIEGIEGAGKSTLAEALAQHIRGQGREVVLTREPGGTGIGDAIRGILLSDSDAMCDRTELLLFEAARAQHVDELIKHAIDRGAVVICDRFADSSLAYQGEARGFGLEAVRALNDFATAGLRPDLTILLDLPAHVGLARQRNVDRISSQGLAFHESVRSGYLSLAQDDTVRFRVIDAVKGVDEVMKQALSNVDAALTEVE